MIEGLASIAGRRFCQCSRCAYERNTNCFKATFSRWNQFTFTSYTAKYFSFIARLGFGLVKGSQSNFSGLQLLPVQCSGTEKSKQIRCIRQKSRSHRSKAQEISRATRSKRPPCVCRAGAIARWTCCSGRSSPGIARRRIHRDASQLAHVDRTEAVGRGRGGRGG